MRKRFDLRDEAIVEPALAIIDAHHHLFDRPAARYLLDDILEDCSLGHDIRATVYIESQFAFDAEGPAHLRPVGETRFASAIAVDCAARGAPVQVNAAIVGFADMTDPRVGDTLEAHVAAGEGRFRGIRQVAMHDGDPAYRALMFAPPPEGLLAHPDFPRGMAELARCGLSFETAILHPQMHDLGRLADRCPETTIVLNHLGFAYGMGQGADAFDAWRDGLADLARRENVVAKIGGFGMPFWGFGFDSAPGAMASAMLADAWRPYVETAIDLFGPRRCMMESNFPADGYSCGYVPLWNALKRITSGLTPPEKRALYWDTATRIYALDIAHPQDATHDPKEKT